MLIKFNRPSISDGELNDLSGEVVFEDAEIVNAQFVGESSYLDGILKKLETKNPLEIVRTGTSGISSNTKTLTIN
jgi:acetolactate synthase small subunit